MYKNLIRPLLFLISPEKIHAFVFFALKVSQKVPLLTKCLKLNYQQNSPELQRELFGLKFKNPIGLAAGMDKDAEVYDAMGYLGFGHVEIGTVTPKPQPGNPRPRLFRLKRNEALINRMGFNNKGVDYALERLKNRCGDVIIGGNIGKNKLTPNDKAIDDYLIGFDTLFPVVDYFVVNVSSPNTPNLRELQEKEPLRKLLMTLQHANSKKPQAKPILLKIAPDLSNAQIDDILEIVQETGLAGVVATNTTISRQDIDYNQTEIAEFGAGGLSGSPLRKRSTDIIRYISEKTNGKLPIVGVGGIMTPEDAVEKLNAGASLIQLYTGFVYSGPSIVKQINKKLLNS